ncbi:hypothetical protein TKK_0005522 [Trichogramma kaykai]|uniref:Uncharacterized protein n=1 Tax=Trichogramma kaykai TaxID=54128 RepID=A0ABD2XIT8_9HYME
MTLSTQKTTTPTQDEPNTNTPTQNTTPTEINTSSPTPESTIPFTQIFSILKEPSQYSETIPKREDPRREEPKMLQKKR